MNMRIIKLEEKDLELISGGKLQAKVKERIEKSTFNTIGYRLGQVTCVLTLGVVIGFVSGGSVKYSKTENFDGQNAPIGHSTTKEFQVNPALAIGGCVIGGMLVGAKIWDEIANKVF